MFKFFKNRALRKAEAHAAEIQEATKAKDESLIIAVAEMRESDKKLTSKFCAIRRDQCFSGCVHFQRSWKWEKGLWVENLYNLWVVESAYCKLWRR